jgi:hypothetical protein
MNDLEKIRKLIGKPQSYKQLCELQQTPEDRQEFVDLLRSWRREYIAELDSTCCGKSDTDHVDAR